MAKSLLLLLILLSTSTIAYCQTSKIREKEFVPTNAQRYGNDYEIINFTLTEQNKAILESIDLASVENLRLDTEDRIVTPVNSTYQVLLYAKNRVNKSYYFNLPNELENETK
jgi:hypothetical protein